MNKLRYSEMFYSLQGEGRYVGVPSLFLRLFGCNFECRGFGQDRDRSKWLPKEQMPHNKDYPNVKAIEDLPVPHVGCDSSFSWGKKWGHLADYDNVNTIIDKINSYIPDTEPIHLVITGGEPLLKGFQPAMSDIILHRKLGLNNITFETNCTQVFKNGFDKFMHGLTAGDYTKQPVHVTWSTSPKLSISGEERKKAIRPEVAYQYSQIPNTHLYFKFVVMDKQDLEEVDMARKAYSDAGVEADIYLMPLGATAEGQAKTAKQVAELCLQYGYKFSPRLHVDLFGNKWGT